MHQVGFSLNERILVLLKGGWGRYGLYHMAQDWVQQQALMKMSCSIDDSKVSHPRCVLKKLMS